MNTTHIVQLGDEYFWLNMKTCRFRLCTKEGKLLRRSHRTRTDKGGHHKMTKERSDKGLDRPANGISASFLKAELARKEKLLTTRQTLLDRLAEVDNIVGIMAA